jgi:ABC-type nickel/cobalt efflux system permease component RcnA
MFGLDGHLAHLSDGATVLMVIAVAILLGLRHATDPDHLAAVTTLIASGRERTRRLAARLGFAWGLGHATSLFAFGMPIVLFKAYLPEGVQEGAETAVGALIVGLALWLLVRWRRGAFHVHRHDHGGQAHVHAHVHACASSPRDTVLLAGGGAGIAVAIGPGSRAPRTSEPCNTVLRGPEARPDHAGAHVHRHTVRVRSPLQAYGIGLLHGIGGSGGVGVLLLATIRSHVLAVAALALFAFFTAVSMALLSTGFGLTLSSERARRSFHRVAPALGCASLLFGVWYALGALQVAPYVF